MPYDIGYEQAAEAYEAERQRRLQADIAKLMAPPHRLTQAEATKRAIEIRTAAEEAGRDETGVLDTLSGLDAPEDPQDHKARKIVHGIRRRLEGDGSN